MDDFFENDFQRIENDIEDWVRENCEENVDKHIASALIEYYVDCRMKEYEIGFVDEFIQKIGYKQLYENVLNYNKTRGDIFKHCKDCDEHKTVLFELSLTDYLMENLIECELIQEEENDSDSDSDDSDDSDEENEPYE
jgi:regulatory protein YycI of two-component signal transduction system YycFG